VPVVGLVPVDWSSVPDPDLIWILEFLVGVFLLLWLKERTKVSISAPQIKIRFCRLVLWQSIGVDELPQACRGGEVRMQAIFPCSGAGVRRGDLLLLGMFAVVLHPADRVGWGRMNCTNSLYRSGGRQCGCTGAASCCSEISTTCSPLKTSAEGQPLHGSRSFSPAAHRRQGSVLPRDSKVVGQPVPPFAPRCWRKVFFLQAIEPKRRSSGSEAVCSRCITLSGKVPVVAQLAVLGSMVVPVEN